AWVLSKGWILYEIFEIDCQQFLTWRAPRSASWKSRFGLHSKAPYALFGAIQIRAFWPVFVGFSEACGGLQRADLCYLDMAFAVFSLQLITSMTAQLRFRFLTLSKQGLHS
ncbi:MAG: hypothetical protein LBI76_05785, partial [Comamonas sp.]|nr:hypothetical protein [Comamonas sp.]